MRQTNDATYRMMPQRTASGVK